MQAYKFNTVIEKGMIHIPIEIQNKLSSQILKYEKLKIVNIFRN